MNIRTQSWQETLQSTYSSSFRMRCVKSSCYYMVGEGGDSLEGNTDRIEIKIESIEDIPSLE